MSYSEKRGGFDPKHAAPDTRKRLRVDQTYEALLEEAREAENDALAEEAHEAAEKLRACQDIWEQLMAAVGFVDEFGIEVP